MRFKRLNISAYAKKFSAPYYFVDFLRQTSVEAVVDALDGCWSAEKTKKYVLGIIEKQLDEMIVEEKRRK